MRRAADNADVFSRVLRRARAAVRLLNRRAMHRPRVSALVVLLSALVFSSAAFAGQRTIEAPVDRGLQRQFAANERPRVIITVKPGASTRVQQLLAKGHVNRQYRLISAVSADVTPGEMQRLRRDGDVLDISTDSTVRANATLDPTAGALTTTESPTTDSFYGSIKLAYDVQQLTATLGVSGPARS